MPSFTVILFFILLVLKLTGVIAWSWWFVTLPLWIGLPVVMLIGAVGAYRVWKGVP